jgi:hypothetical protein
VGSAAAVAQLERPHISFMQSRRHFFTRPGFIFAVALMLRLATAAIFLHQPDIYRGGAQMTIDSAAMLTEGYEAVGVAQSLARGNGFAAPWPGAGPTAWLTPVMPAMLAADMRVFGLHSRATLIAFVIFNELPSALTIFPVFFAARRIADGLIPGGPGADRIAALAAWLLVLNPAAGLAACKFIWYTTLSGLLGALLLWATLAVRDSESRAAWIEYGLLWGAELMTHPSFLVWMPVAILWLVWPRLGSKPLTLPALAGLTAVLCCVPWTVRNFAVFHHFVPLRTNFGFELWRYNHGGIPFHPNSDAVERDAFSSLGEYEYTKEKQHEALIWINAHPAAYLLETALRVMRFWFDRAHPLSNFVRLGQWFWKAKFLYICALFVMMLWGLITIRRKRREYFWLLASVPAIFPLVYYLALAQEFHRFPIDPVLAIIAAFAVSAWLPTQVCDGSAMATLRPNESRTGRDRTTSNLFSPSEDAVL